MKWVYLVCLTSGHTLGLGARAARTDLETISQVQPQLNKVRLTAQLALPLRHCEVREVAWAGMTQGLF